MEAAELVILQHTLCILWQIQFKATTIAAHNAHHITRIVFKTIVAPVEGLTMQHRLHSKVHVGYLEEHFIEQLEADGCKQKSIGIIQLCNQSIVLYLHWQMAANSMYSKV